MKTLIILSAFLLVLSSCTKEMPVPDPNSDSTYIPDPDPGYDPGPTYDPDPDPDPDPAPDPGDDGPPTCRIITHGSGTGARIVAANK